VFTELPHSMVSFIEKVEMKFRCGLKFSMAYVVALSNLSVLLRNCVLSVVVLLGAIRREGGLFPILFGLV
jgi:hypothetical protein